MLVAGARQTPGVLPQTTLHDQGYKGRVYQTRRVGVSDFVGFKQSAGLTDAVGDL